MILRNSLVIGFLLISILSCRKTEVYSEIPEIGYKSFWLRDTTDLLGNRGLVGLLTFTFVDGDGDLGLMQPPDTAKPGDPNYHNLFFKIFTPVNGLLTEIPEQDLAFPLAYRIPYMEPEGPDMTLKGEIEVEFNYLAFPYDTISYEFYIVDRAGHESNVENTPVFIIPDLDSLNF